MKKLIKFIIFVILIAAFVYFGTKDYNVKKKNIEKNEKNASSVLLNGDYVFNEINHSKVLNKLSSKNDSIIYICIDGNKLCTKYGLLIDEVAKNYSIDTIYYYDIKEDRENNNGTYQKIISKLTNYILTDDLGKQNLYSPTLIFIKKGEVTIFDDSLSINRGEIDIDKIWTEELVNAKTEFLYDAMEGFINNE